MKRLDVVVAMVVALSASDLGAQDTTRALDWTLIYARPATGKYEDISFADPTHGWVVTARGDILNTADGGASWTTQASGLQGLRSVDFLDRMHGFAGTLTGKLYETTDGGAVWTEITSSLPKPAKGFCGITHVGKRVHIVGRYTGGATDYFYSPDGGKTWQVSDLADLASGLVDVSFLNEKVGFIGGMGKSKAQGQPGAATILKTTDGGQHWHTVFEHDGGRGFAWKLFPVTAKLIYAALQSQDGIYRIAKTTDAGDHWETLIVATGRPPGPAVQGIGFADANTGWVGGFFRGMYMTTDGGHTWTYLPVADGIINRFERVGNTLVTAGTRGVLRYDPRQHASGDVKLTPVAPSTLLTNISLLDGTGSSARRSSVRITGDRVTDVGALTPRADDQIVDGGGLTLAPGFIDTHSHADRSLMRGSDGLGALSQGITTVVVGEDGSSPYPLAPHFDSLTRAGIPINVASYVGHGTIRGRVMGTDYKRHATTAEIARMKEVLADEMRSGALGLSSGLEYDPGIYSAREEVVELAKVAAAAHGRYISHIRSEDRAEWEAFDEIINIGRQAHLPVQISHAKLAMKSLWGRADSLIRLLDRARASGVDITADIYPYRYWQSGLSVLFPERNFDDRKAAQFALDEVAPPDGITLTNYGPHPEYAGKTVTQIAALNGTDPVTTLMKLVKDADEARKAKKPSGETIIAASMDERDIERIMAWPFTNICTDGELDGRHPRGYGSFTRVLGRYVREQRVTTVPEMIRKMTSLAADNVGIRGRGRIAPGAPADLVLFDERTVIDNATPAEPHAVSTGIAKVWVNGVLAYENGRVTSARAGQIVRRP